MIISGAGLLNRTPHLTETEILRIMEGNVCRCGTYPRVVAASQQTVGNAIFAATGVQLRSLPMVPASLRG